MTRATAEAIIRFPVVCAKCGRESLLEYPLTTMATRLNKLHRLPLEAKCCGVVWDATAVELEQIREYLGAVAVSAGRH